ncbi:MAG: arsenite efflux transporter metallochaperone ArsD [Rhodobacteraceae bacterium]|nr:arsenite efflux transporter metallochaperone ArsD [Paracoccaceae bacterium]
MTTLTVYDPAMCCSTGLCGTQVDQRLVDLAADLDWLKEQGVTVRRYGLSREPTEFAANETIRQIMQESEGDDLPAFLVDGALKAKARYPARAELAEWVGLAAPQAGRSVTASSCCGSAKAEPAAATGCCDGSAKSAPVKEKAGSCC